MRVAKKWQDYEIIDTSSGDKLERFGDIVVIRPDPQIIWYSEKQNKGWKNSHAQYNRSNKGGGEWKDNKKFNKNWTIKYDELVFNIKPTNFKHMGIFPEQAVNWDYFKEIIGKEKRQINVLNLFAYTGGATLACASAGASVCHVDASKGMVAWAKQNAQSSNLGEKPIRWIVDDCEKFVTREINRGKKYDAIIMDPPSYGRGPNGEVWQLEEHIHKLVELCSRVLSDEALFFALNSYTTGLSPSVMEYLLGMTVAKKFGGKVSSDEIGLPVTQSGYVLPCGSTAIWERK
jgi:23S rRNA (cytosine1962-C5)-methyltransferase